MNTKPTQGDVDTFLRELTELSKKHGIAINGQEPTYDPIVESWATGRTLAHISLVGGNYVVTRRVE